MVSGDLTQRVNIKNSNEIGILATSFNTMANTLDAKISEQRNLRNDTGSYLILFRSVFINVNPESKGHLHGLTKQVLTFLVMSHRKR
jgi:methyl-accepting chemotaxis protein